MNSPTEAPGLVSEGPVEGATRRVAADDAGIAAAALVLRAEKLVAFPTETVYGLGADASRPAAVARIYAAKGRPAFNPLIAHVGSRDVAAREGVFSPLAEKLADAFWPGPLTLVVPRAETGTVCDLARAGLASVALRMPAHPIAAALLAAADRPIAAPSANRSGRLSPVTAAHVLADLDGAIDMVLDGGACPVGLESTIIACLDSSPVLLRPGGVPRAAIEAVVGPLVRNDASELLAPGMLASHYAPRARLRLAATTLAPGEAGLDFGGVFAGASNVLDLSPGRDLTEAAANLFAHLRALDARNIQAIAVAPIPMTGLGEAINDRLARAAAPRPE